MCSPVSLPAPAQAEALPDGRFRLSFPATHAGEWWLLCEVAGSPVAQTPALCVVEAAEADADKSRLFGPGTERVQLGCARA